MKDELMVQVFIDKNKDMILVPYKLCKFGYAVAVGPYKKLDHVEWKNLSREILGLFTEISGQPRTEETESIVMREICGNKGFKRFSKEHICIQVDYMLDEGRYIISNQPRLSSGAYGTEKDSVSERFCIRYVSTHDADLIQEDLLKAYDDARQYLEEIGGTL